MNRRSFLRTAPAAVAAGPAVAKTVIDDIGIGVNSPAYSAARVIPVGEVGGESSWAEDELRNLLKLRKEAMNLELPDAARLRIRAASIDGMKSLSIVTKTRMAQEAAARHAAKQEIGFISRRIEEIKKGFPLLAALAETLE